jgi:hypothetical protein
MDASLLKPACCEKYSEAYGEPAANKQAQVLGWAGGERKKLTLGSLRMFSLGEAGHDGSDTAALPLALTLAEEEEIILLRCPLQEPRRTGVRMSVPASGMLFEQGSADRLVGPFRRSLTMIRTACFAGS